VIPTSSPTAAFIYFDDILIASENAIDAESFTESIIQQFIDHHLIVNMRKTIRRATSSISFLGYTITAPHYNDTWITTASVPPTLPGPNRPLSAMGARMIAGALLWKSRLTLPFVAPLFYHRDGAHLTTSTSSLLSSAASLATRVRQFVPGCWAAARSRIALSTTTFFTDANAVHGRAACISTDGFCRSWRIPQFLLHQRHHTAQQLAELYAVYRTIRIVFARKLFNALVVSDSTSALSSMIRLSPKGNRERARLLRHVAWLRAEQPRHHIIFGFIRSEYNPADPLTHDPPVHDEARARLSHIQHVYPIPGLRPHTDRCQAVVRCPVFGD
jgi:hypothetical protein